MNDEHSPEEKVIAPDHLQVESKGQERSKVKSPEGCTSWESAGSGAAKACKCGASNPPSCKFCVQCGSPLNSRQGNAIQNPQRACCKSSSKAGLRFCVECGTAVSKHTSSFHMPDGLALPTGLLVCAVLFLFLGLTLPAVTMQPSLGGGFIEWWVDVFSDEMTATTFSILGGIGHLFADGETILAIIILSFSVIFPTAKALLLLVIVGNEGGLVSLSSSLSAKLHDKGMKYASYLGKYSMVDVLVISIIVVAFKGFPGGSKVVAEVGIYCFALQVVLSLIGTHYLKRYLDEARDTSVTT